MNPPPVEEPIRVLLVAQHALIRESLVRLVQSDTSFEIVGHCGSPGEAQAILGRESPDVVVVDIEVADSPLDCFITAVLQDAPGLKILVIQNTDDISGGLCALRSGAVGLVDTDDSPETFLRAIRMVASGSAWLNRTVIQSLAEFRAIERQRKFPLALLPIEEQVLAAVCDGLTNNAIAAQTGISQGTVKAILRRLYHRTGARTRSQLVRLAITSPGPLAK
jgi:two-component system, NarL family, nitrate/nitrite response regulator NarL